MKKIIIRNLQIYTPISKDMRIRNENFFVDNFPHFPVLLNSDGSVWKYANLYLLSRIKEYKQPSSKTLDSIANDLKDFGLWCVQNEIDYLKAERKILSPTYRYRGSLQEKYVKGEISESSIKRKISSVIGFYRYLIAVQQIHFKFPLWEEGISSISYFDNKGFMQSKQVVTTDIGKTSLIQREEYSNSKVIKDGGKLCPLTEHEQKVMFKCLKEIGNREMSLGFLISVATGARMGTVYTLRLKHFAKTVSDNEKEVGIKVGYGTDCDTKNNKKYMLYFPVWLYNAIRVYINSPRSKKRRNKAKHIFENNSMQYVFLNNRGKPYYVANNDPYKIEYMDIPRGNTIRVFINTALKKHISLSNEDIEFSFHDLRATYGMNTLNKIMPLVEKEEKSLSFVLNFIKERMGHSSLVTTEHYLNFRKINKFFIKSQESYEKHLMELI